MSLETYAYWLDETAPSIALKDSFVAIPLAQSVHILAVAFLFSGSLILCLRGYGVIGREWPVAAWSRKLTGRLWIAFALLLGSGSVLVLAEPTRELLNMLFQAKIALVVPAAALAIWVGYRQARRAGATDGVLRHLNIVVVLLWLAIIGAGRWIAYI